MRIHYVFAVLVVGCASTLSLSVTPPKDDPSAIVLEFWNGQKVIDPGGRDRACDRGCVSFAQEEIYREGDAGTVYTHHQIISRTAQCLRLCTNTKPVRWEDGGVR